MQVKRAVLSPGGVLGVEGLQWRCNRIPKYISESAEFARVFHVVVYFLEMSFCNA